MDKKIKKYIKLLRRIIGSFSRRHLPIQKRIIKIGRFLYLILCFFIEIPGDFISLFIRKKKIIEKDNKSLKILIIKMDQFGDVIFSTFLAEIINKNLPQSEIHYLIHPKIKDLFINNPIIKKVYFWDDPILRLIPLRKERKEKLSWHENLKTIKDLKQEKYDFVINARAEPPSSNLFWKFIKGKKLISFDVSDQAFLADYQASYNFWGDEINNYFNLLKPVGNFKREFNPAIYNFDEIGLKRKISSKNYLSTNKVVISPITFDKDRYWCLENWAKIIDFLGKRGFSVFLTGIDSQREYLKNIFNLCSVKPEIITNLNIGEFAELIRQSKLFLGIDSFPLHLAVALKKPIVCVINPKAYYLPNISQGIFYESKALAPQIPSVKYCYLPNCLAEEIIAEIKKLII